MHETTVEVAGVGCHVVYAQEPRAPLAIGLTSLESGPLGVYGSLAYALPSTSGDGGSVVSLLMKNSSDGASEVAKSIASLAAEKFHRPVFVNCSVADPADRVLLSKELIGEISSLLA